MGIGVGIWQGIGRDSGAGPCSGLQEFHESLLGQALWKLLRMGFELAQLVVPSLLAQLFALSQASS